MIIKTTILARKKLRINKVASFNAVGSVISSNLAIENLPLNPCPNLYIHWGTSFLSNAATTSLK